METKRSSKSKSARTRQVNRQPLVGPCCKGPARCLKCGKGFGMLDSWWRNLSPEDGEYGRYAIGLHEHCPEPPDYWPQLDEEDDTT